MPKCLLSPMSCHKLHPPQTTTTPPATTTAAAAATTTTTTTAAAAATATTTKSLLRGHAGDPGERAEGGRGHVRRAPRMVQGPARARADSWRGPG